MKIQKKVLCRTIKKNEHEYRPLEVLDMELYVKGERIPMNEFVNNVLRDIVMAVLTNLRDIDIDTIERIEIN